LKRIAIWGIGAIALALVAASCIRKQVNEQSLSTSQFPPAAVPLATTGTAVPAPLPPTAKSDPAPVLPSAAPSQSAPVASNSVAPTAPVAPAAVKQKQDISSVAPPLVKPQLSKPVVRKMNAPKKKLYYKAKKPVAYAKKKRAVLKTRPARLATIATQACSNKAGQRVLNSICFATNSSALSNESKRKLSAAAKQLKAAANQRLEVAGFTDGSGSNQSNIQLSQRRSQAVVDYLVAQGVDRAMLTNKGYGQESAKRAQQHRRVDLKVMQP
jgi:outer membrane protein OmpA-like peptidoglycan-associated protein